MKNYINPQIEIILFAIADVITASVGNDGENSGDGSGIF